MPPPSQRPLVNKLLALEPLTFAQREFTSIDDALLSLDRRNTMDALAVALGEHGVMVSVRTLYRWKDELLERTA